jgi:hypothetical protein
MNRVAEVIAKEIREAIPATLFFMAVFHMIIITKNVILEGYQATPTSSAVAVVGALIVAKAILIVEKLPLAHLFGARRLYNIAWKTLLFGAVWLLFRFVEELIPLLRQHEGLAAATTRLIGEMSWLHFLVIQMWLLASLFLYCLAAELARKIGGARVREILLGSK